MNAGQGSISVVSNNPAPGTAPPFALTAANNGLSVDPVSQKIVLGNNVGLVTAILLNQRVIPTDTFDINLLSSNGNAINFFPLSAAITVNNTSGTLFVQISSDTLPIITLLSDASANIAGQINFTGGGTTSDYSFVNNPNGLVINTFDLRPALTAARGFRMFNTGNMQIGLVDLVDTLQALKVIGSLMVTETIQGKKLVATAAGIISATLDNRKLFSSEANGVNTDMALPTAAVGLEYEFYVQNAFQLRIIAAAGDTIRIAGSVSAVAGNIASVTIGSFVKLVAINATEWVATSMLGVWVVT